MIQLPVRSNKEIIGEENKELESEKKVIADKAASKEAII